MFNLLVILYLFLGGCGGGLLLLTALSSLVFHHSAKRTTDETQKFRELRNRAYIVALLIILLGATCLFLDLGRPDRLYLLVTRPKPTLISIGSYVLAATILMNIVMVATNSFYLPRISSTFKKIMEGASVLLAFALVAYVGLYLLQLSSIPFWDNWMIPILFVVSSLSTGSAVLFLLAMLGGGRELLRKRLHHMQTARAIMLVCEFVFLALLVWTSTFNSTATRSLMLLIFGDLRFWFFGGAVVCGIVLPFVEELFHVLFRRRARLMFVDALCLFGGFSLRYCIISAGVY